MALTTVGVEGSVERTKLHEALRDDTELNELRAKIKPLNDRFYQRTDEILKAYNVKVGTLAELKSILFADNPSQEHLELQDKGQSAL